MLDYVIATTGRNGSNFLRSLLKNNGLSRPYEHFGYAFGFPEALESGISVDEFAEQKRKDETTNGIYGVKLQSGHLNRICSKFPDRFPGHEDFLSFFFPQAKYIWMRRRDLDRQAISFWRAQNTDQWGVLDETTMIAQPKGPLNCERVEELRNIIIKRNKLWEETFRKLGVEPLCFWYEDIIEDRAGTLRKVFKHLELPLPETLNLNVEPRKQSDATTEIHLEQYLTYRNSLSGEG